MRRRPSDAARHLVEAWRARGRPLVVPGASTRVWQQGEGEPVVCLHGMPASSFTYRNVLAGLAARGLRGVAFDMPGLGLAERPEGFDYRWSSQALWTLAAVDALGLRRFHLVVHDSGGPIGFELARLAPERIASLTALNTLVNCATARRPPEMEPYAHRVVGRLWLALTNPLTFELGMRRIGVTHAVPREVILAYLLLLRGNDRGLGMLRAIRGFELTAEFERRIRGHLARRPYPAQVLWGRWDPGLKLATTGEDVRAALGVSAVCRLNGKHFVQEESAGEIARLVALLAGGQPGESRHESARQGSRSETMPPWK
ncbi:MAG: alpha/beta fold hydrolase [Myxococcota bacterium]